MPKMASGIMKKIKFIAANFCILDKKRIQYLPLYPLNNQSDDTTFKINNIKLNQCILFPGWYVS
ncbi:MAG: hypothetical protein BWY26_00736 [Elusimicrobia bacterium ADurb.Bin231]|nr:MAG: hypothetical protein BWY26_00736 [Elusimicrobia bacterium ADurb.Bin231]